MAHSTLIIGLTGGIACGKTTVTNHFAELGVPILDADVIARELVQPGQPTLELLKIAFGTHICRRDGSLDRDLLRRQVFSVDSQRRQLEAILHPRIFQVLWSEVAQVQTPYCILSVPLLIETQWVQHVNRVLVVDCPVAVQRQRLKARNGFADAEIERILAAQISRPARLAEAHDVIDTRQTLTQMAQHIRELHNEYLTLAQRYKKLNEE